MTAPHVDTARVLGNLLAEASSDMMRTWLQTTIDAVLSADAVVGAEWGRTSLEPTTQRVSSRPGGSVRVP